MKCKLRQPPYTSTHDLCRAKLKNPYVLTEADIKPHVDAFVGVVNDFLHLARHAVYFTDTVFSVKVPTCRPRLPPSLLLASDSLVLQVRFAGQRSVLTILFYARCRRSPLSCGSWPLSATSSRCRPPLRQCVSSCHTMM